MITPPGLSSLQADILAGKTSCVAITTEYVRRIQSFDTYNIHLELYAEEALKRAEEIDDRLRQGQAGKLAGLVVGIKDVICYANHVVTAGSKILAGFQSQIHSTVVERLLAADAIIIGRHNCDEFAMGSSNENSSYGPVQNPWREGYVPGGSSGASAAAVSANFCHAALGSDTGGSVRQPAGFCNIIGLKPTYGRISRWGLIAYASSLDQIGIMGHHIEDVARILEIIAGPDGKDNTASPTPVPSYSQMVHTKPQKPFRVGFIRETLDHEGLDPEIRTRMYDLIESLSSQGVDVVEVHFPYLSYLAPCYYILTPAEASSNLSRFDGIRYGHRSDSHADLESLYKQSRNEGFGKEVKRRIALGAFVLSAGYFDAYYTKAMKVRRLIREHTQHLLTDCDFLLSPTTPTPPFRIGEKTDDPISMYLSDIYTVHANLAGLPAISLPIGMHSNGLPFGVQLMARPFEEGALLQFSSQLLKFEGIQASYAPCP